MNPEDDQAVLPAPRAVVVDELALVRAGIGAILHGLDADVAGETRAARDASVLVANERPDVVVLGTPADLPIASAARRLLRFRPAPRVAVVLPPGREHEVRYLVALGAAAVVPRTAPAGELRRAFEAAIAGERFVGDALHAALVGPLRPLAERAGDATVLSAREREVLVLLAEGRSNREIADALSVTTATAKSHLARIYGKFGVSNRRAAVARAVALDLLT